MLPMQVKPPTYQSTAVQMDSTHKSVGVQTACKPLLLLYFQLLKVLVHILQQSLPSKTPLTHIYTYCLLVHDFLSNGLLRKQSSHRPI
jgi:hypothetical protein